jgi:hypothetical protein
MLSLFLILLHNNCHLYWCLINLLILHWSCKRLISPREETLSHRVEVLLRRLSDLRSICLVYVLVIVEKSIPIIKIMSSLSPPLPRLAEVCTVWLESSP